MFTRALAKGMVIIITAMLLFPFLSPRFVLIAAGGLELTVGVEKASRGEQLEVTISGNRFSGTEGGQLVMRFDPFLVRPVYTEAGDLVRDAEGGLYMANLEYADDSLMLMWITASADTADSGAVAKIVFELLRDGETLLELADIVIAPENIGTVTASNGMITILDAEVAQDNSEEKPLDQDNSDVVEVSDIEQPGGAVKQEDIDEEHKNTEEAAGISYSWVIVFLIAAFLVLSGVFIFRRPGKALKIKKK